MIRFHRATRNDSLDSMFTQATHKGKSSSVTRALGVLHGFAFLVGKLLIPIENMRLHHAGVASSVKLCHLDAYGGNRASGSSISLSIRRSCRTLRFRWDIEIVNVSNIYTYGALIQGLMVAQLVKNCPLPNLACPDFEASTD